MSEMNKISPTGFDAGTSMRATKKWANYGQIFVKEDLEARQKEIGKILNIEESERSEEQKNFLVLSPDLVKKVKTQRTKTLRKKERELEKEDSQDELVAKCDTLSDAIVAANNLVLYTGAGISTSASIPDYRGPNGVWTRLDKGQSVVPQDLVDADPTYTHMAIAELCRAGRVKHVISQNCDGLHLRSGVSRELLSEIHGNMLIEVCPKCAAKSDGPAGSTHEYVRLFDVTEKTGLHRHKTSRRCHNCQEQLHDTIIHFGEKSRAMEGPYRWKQAVQAAEGADVIICVGSSLKILKNYLCLWAMDRPPKLRPKLYIINLQWTPKDSIATLKINGRCDAILEKVISRLGLAVPQYVRESDPVFRLAVPLQEGEYESTTKKTLKKEVVVSLSSDSGCGSPTVSDEGSIGNVSCPGSAVGPGWYGLGCKKRRRLK